MTTHEHTHTAGLSLLQEATPLAFDLIFFPSHNVRLAAASAKSFLFYKTNLCISYALLYCQGKKKKKQAMAIGSCHNLYSKRLITYAALILA